MVVTWGGTWPSELRIKKDFLEYIFLHILSFEAHVNITYKNQLGTNPNRSPSLTGSPVLLSHPAPRAHSQHLGEVGCGLSVAGPWGREVAWLH